MPSELNPIPRPIPTSARTNAMITKTMTAITAIANALSQPQSKKCLISPSHIINIIIEETIPPKREPTSQFTIEPITMPSTTIQMASVNLAFCLPASALPTSHSTGATTIIATTICIKNPIQSKTDHYVVIYVWCF